MKPYTNKVDDNNFGTFSSTESVFETQQPTIDLSEMAVILLIEDDEAVRKVVSRRLQNSGFYVLEAANGHEGAEIFRRHHSRVNLIVSDVTMPHLTGTQMLKQLRTEYGHLPPVVITTGYTSHERDLIEVRADAVLQKPMGVNELLEVIHDLLELSGTSIKHL